MNEMNDLHREALEAAAERAGTRRGIDSDFPQPLLAESCDLRR